MAHVLLALLVAVTAALATSPVAPSPDCSGLASTPVPAEAVVDRRILADVDGDGLRDLITGYHRPTDTAEGAYLHLELASGWGTEFRVDTVADFGVAALSEPRGVVVVSGVRLIVADVAAIAVGRASALFRLEDCALSPVPLTAGGYPDLWVGIGPAHSEWFSCRDDGVVQLQVSRSDTDPDVYDQGTASLYRLEADGLRTAEDLPLGLPRSEADLRSDFPPCPAADGTFGDDDGSVFEADIEWLAAEGISRGCNPPTNDRYCPHDPVTRGQMAALLVRALGYTDAGGGDHFTDDDQSIFQTDIDRLATAGITRGCNPPTNDRYCPHDPVTRAQMAAFLRRALE